MLSSQLSVYIIKRSQVSYEAVSSTLSGQLSVIIHALRSAISLYHPRSQVSFSLLSVSVILYDYGEDFLNNVSCAQCITNKEVFAHGFVFPFSLYLFRLGLAPQIHDLCGKVKFTGNVLFVISSYG